MIPLRRVLQSFEHGLKVLIEKTQDMQKMFDTLEEALTAEKPKTKTAAKKKPAKKAAVKKKPARKTATHAVVNIIQKSRKGVTTAQIKKKTGLSEKQIWNVVNRAKRQGKIKSEKKGIYVEA